VERTDAELVRLARTGDRAAFQELVERYQRKIYTLVLGMLHDHEAAWETSQETFLKALRSLDHFKGEASFYTWLYRIAVNLAIDYQRHEWHRPTVASVPDAAIEVQEGIQDELRRDDPFRHVKSREIGERVRAAIDQLTPEHRAVILLREVEGLSYDEISRVMECAKGTVMSRLHYARKKLQTLLRDCL
jgi:RNA polymerase sigma-70 factor (ECF subfamily)